MLSSYLQQFWVHQASPTWVRKCYPDFQTLENSIVQCKVQLPANINKSLPYATRMEYVNIQVKHNIQKKVCNLWRTITIWGAALRTRFVILRKLYGHGVDFCPDKTVPEDEDLELSSSVEGVILRVIFWRAPEDRDDDVKPNDSHVKHDFEFLVIDEEPERRRDYYNIRPSFRSRQKRPHQTTMTNRTSPTKMTKSGSRQVRVQE